MISTFVLLKDQPTTRLPQQTPFSIQRLLAQIKNADLSNEEERYYALSTHFIENSSIYIQGQSKKDANCKLFVEQNTLRGELIEGLLEKKDFVVITEILLQYLWKECDCKSVEVKRRIKYSKRWFIYKEIIEYVVLDKRIIQKEKLEQIVEVKAIQMFPIATINQVYNKILLFENLELKDIHKMWISSKKLPLSLSKSSIDSNNQQKQKKRLNELQFIEHTFFVTSPEIFRVRKRFKNFGFVLQTNNCSIIKRADIECPRHENKLAIMSCLCLKRRTFSCSQICFQQNHAHKKSCIYIPFGFSDDQKIQLIKLIKDRQVGLKNQSSLCYFNSIVQSVFHIKQLADFFVKRKEYKIINYCNTNGTWGEIAIQFGKTLRRYFKQPKNQDVGNQFYNIVSRWHHSFSNQHTQQDAHEMLIKLLDWLKQDLNINQKKISYRSIETKGKNEDQIWEQALSTQRGRNNSIIENNFQGFQKSFLECKTCNKKSINFQNFITIQLPMVGEIKKQITYKTVKIYFLPYKPQERINRINLSLTGNERTDEVKNLVKKIIPPNMSGSFALYKVDYSNIQLIDDSNKFLLFADMEKPIFAIQAKPAWNQNDKLILKISFLGQQIPPFARIIYFPDFCSPLKIYMKVFNFCTKAKQSKQISSNYVNKYYSCDQFPFDLIFKNDRQELKVQRNLQHDQAIKLTEYTQIIVKIRGNPDFKFKNMNCCTQLSREGFQAKDTQKYIYSDPSIQDCISAFCKKEQINDLSWMCQNCNILRNAVKSLSFHRLPKILIFSLNRFRKDSLRQEGFPTFIKNEKRITFQAILDMSPFIRSKQKQTYRLITVVVHVRLTRSNTNIENSSGHYYSYIRTCRGWKQFNDSFVGEVSESKVLSNQNAYILFYQKVQQKE